MSCVRHCHRHLALIATALALVVWGCDDNTGGCSDDEGLVDGDCVPLSSVGGSGGGSGDAVGSDAGGDVVSSPDAAPDEGPAEVGDGGGQASALGDPCADPDQHTDCHGDYAHYCSVQPGATEGYCSPTGCVETPELCPEGWKCFDLSLFDPSLPSICIEE